jgi:hypothetical protein
MRVATIFKRFVNRPHGAVIHFLVDMKVQGVGELTNEGSYWRLVYYDCGHVQAFAREGLDDPEGAAFFVRRHYAKCLTCALAHRPVPAESLIVDPDQVHLVLSAEELGAIVSALRSTHRPELADRLAEVLRQLRRNP